MTKYIDFGEFVERCRTWQKNNPEWELICDIKDQDSLYYKFNELPKKDRMYYVGRYGEFAKDVYEEDCDLCKVPYGFLDNDLTICNNFPHGNGMMVFKTSELNNNGKGKEHGEDRI